MLNPKKCLFRGCMVWGLMLAILSAIPAHAASQSGLKVKVLAQGNGGVYVGFTTQPAACAGNYNKTHGFIRQSISMFDHYYALLMKKRALDQPVMITYDDVGDCTDAVSTLIITDVK